MFILDKMSHPGWELKTAHIEHVRWMLEQHVCKSCKMTEQEYREAHKDEEQDIFGEECLEKGWNPFTYSDFFPENYKELPDKEKIDLLLMTACGCEFALDEEE